MCLAIPGEILEIIGDELQRTGRLRFGPLTKEINLCLTPEAQVGDFVLVHAGFAINLINKQEALRTLAVMENCNKSEKDTVLLDSSNPKGDYIESDK